MWQIGFLTEWQLYAQKLEGDAWIGEKLDKSNLDKMSGEDTSSFSLLFLLGMVVLALSVY